MCSYTAFRLTLWPCHFMPNQHESTFLLLCTLRNSASMQLCVLIDQIGHTAEGIKRNNSCVMECESGRSLCIVLIKSVWRWIRKHRFWMWGVAGFVLCGGSHWDLFRPACCCCCCCSWLSVYISDLNAVFPWTSSWGWPLVTSTLVSRLKTCHNKTLLISLLYENT